MEIKPIEYQLQASALLPDVVNMDGAKAMSNANISEELALYHLATNPVCEERFIRLPHDWKDRVEAYRQRKQQAQPGTTEEVKKAAEPRAKRTTKKSTEKTNE